MEKQSKSLLKTVSRTIRFSSAEQVALITRAAKHKGLPFNTLVTQASETAATQLLETEPRDAKTIVAAAVHEAHTKR
jgi:antitoxin component of RelBE/YafQ-DinJ toxin-antitoxin module